ncbi:hypothetical protein ERO13_D12G120150v2 [Gossypium hirsutum]|uniref:Uncharacterized protein n=2 Tax=Gossypium TaxID=3633 RepID=A0A5J5NXX2_GOSBA|nr:hypothetical protein ES319_D12G133800v1 [Gossypium barbadense]KAG4115659.1 hypothetical protein ERO13_D12G120150v2 [Gossypium hirsutum]TYG41022.1 hypothetical protein ES288_D12G142200v1 [Gossypium darwinii]TYG41023.1 hypothetical protein ES288_D12G142200v1 [Gossypium darwinii]
MKRRFKFILYNRSKLVKRKNWRVSEQAEETIKLLIKP